MGIMKSRWRSRGYVGGVLTVALGVGAEINSIVQSGQGDFSQADAINIALVIAGALAAKGRLDATTMLR